MEIKYQILIKYLKMQLEKNEHFIKTEDIKEILTLLEEE